MRGLKPARDIQLAQLERFAFRRRAHASACACPRRLKPPLYTESKSGLEKDSVAGDRKQSGAGCPAPLSGLLRQAPRAEGYGSSVARYAEIATISSLVKRATGATMNEASIPFRVPSLNHAS